MGIRSDRRQRVVAERPALVDYGKLDAGLAMALDEGGDDDAPRLPVFVHVDQHQVDEVREALAALGVSGPLSGGIATATLSPNQVRRLSDEPQVRHVRLATPLNLLE